jgi:hypothetical protein
VRIGRGVLLALWLALVRVTSSRLGATLGSMPGKGKPFSPVTAREAARRSHESRSRRKVEARAYEAEGDLTDADELTAIAVLRQQMRSPDERIAHAAALKVLEWRKGKPSPAPPEKSDVRIVFETRALPLEASNESD